MHPISPGAELINEEPEMATMDDTMLRSLIIAIGFCSAIGYLILQPALVYRSIRAMLALI
jgi:hypothetical protein